MHIALTGVTGVWNRGVQALVDSAVTEIHQRWPDARISVLTSDIEHDRAHLPDAAIGVTDASRFFGMHKSVRPALRGLLAARGISGSGGSAALEALQTLKDADLVIALGGDIFSSDYGSRTLRRHVATLEAAQARGTPTAILAHSIGPFATADDAGTMRKALERSALLTVRESLTQDYLAAAFKLGPERAVHTADIAFLLEPSEPDRTDAILAGLDLEEGKFIAMAPSQGITVFSSVHDNAAHDAAWLDAIETVLASTGHSVLLVPHVQAPRSQNDDARLAFRLLEKMKFNPRVRAAFGPYSARDYKAMIARSRFLIGERMHACIAALSSGVPAITIGYSVKARGIVHDVFGAKAEEFQMIVPVAKFVEPGRIARMIATVDDNVQSIRALMQSRLPAIHDRAEDNFTRLAALLGAATGQPQAAASPTA